jgi:hypothetical protein
MHISLRRISDFAVYHEETRLPACNLIDTQLFE